MQNYITGIIYIIIKNKTYNKSLKKIGLFQKDTICNTRYNEKYEHFRSVSHIKNNTLNTPNIENHNNSKD